MEQTDTHQFVFRLLILLKVPHSYFLDFYSYESTSLTTIAVCKVEFDAVNEFTQDATINSTIDSRSEYLFPVCSVATNLLCYSARSIWPITEQFRIHSIQSYPHHYDKQCYDRMLNRSGTQGLK